jgi:DNA helicase IV
VTSIEAERQAEQDYFDRAWQAREDSRATLGRAQSAATSDRGTRQRVAKKAKEYADALGAPDEAVAMGRLDMGGDVYYVGRHPISDADREKLVVSWKSPVADPFYRATIQSPMGVDRIRKFQTTKNTISAFEDLVLAELTARVAELTQDERLGVNDTLLAELDKSRSGEMQDIVQTIHASQHELISFPLDRLLVIQGGPGTGKTAVALHRVSWLLFNHRDQLGLGDVLVVGPSDTFSNYIRKVLPGLGDADVEQRSVKTLGPQSSDGREELLETARLKGSAAMADLLSSALRQRVRFPERDSELVIGQGQNALRLSRAQIEGRLEEYRAATTYNAGRQAMRGWLVTEVEKYQIDRTPAGSTLASVEVDQPALDAALERIWPQLSPQQFLQDLLGSRDRLGDAAGDDFTAGDIRRLYRQSAARLASETWTDSDVALLDEAEALIRGGIATFPHIVVDEAQDMSPMQLRSIRRRSRTGSYTIVGDIAQSTGPWSRESWNDVLESLALQCDSAMKELELGYRVPRQIFDFAAKLLPAAAPQVVPPTVVRQGPADPEILEVHHEDLISKAITSAQAHAGKGRFVGIVCAAADHQSLAASLHAQGVTFDDASTGRIGSSINLMTAEQSKGLEFDAVVVVEPSSIAGTGRIGLRHLYIALTRATKYLTVTYSQQMLELGLEGGAPAEATLEGALGTQDAPQPPRQPAEEPGPSTETTTPHDRTGPVESTDRSLKHGGAARQRVSSGVVEAAAVELALEMKETLVPQLWTEVVVRIVEELGITHDDLLDALIEIRSSPTNRGS